MTTLTPPRCTPLLTLENIHVKLECTNPGGSVKDRIAAFMLAEAERRGEVRPGDTIVEATSGNTGIAFAMLAKARGYRALIFMPEHMSVERRRMIEACGAEVRLTPRAGGFEEPVRQRDAYRGRPGHWVPDQFGNPDNVRCHRTTTGRELLDALRERNVTELDAFVAGVGTGGTLMGVGAALREVWPKLRLVAVEPSESNVMCGKPAGEHGIFGIGDGFVPPIVDLELVDEVIAVSTAAAHAAAAGIRRMYGYCVGVSSGANLTAARELRHRGLRVATLWPDSADRYASVGLEGPTHFDVSCPERATCAARGEALLRPCAR